MRTCPTCGQSGLPDDTLMCPRCRRAMDDGPIAAAPTASYACGHPVVEGNARCRFCDADEGAAGYALETPWGAVPVPASGLRLGRDPGFSPHAAALAAADNVSRRHVTLRPDEDGVLVEDHGSANGTFVDAVQLTPWQAELARAGAEIRLGTDPPLVLRVVSA